jgi:hypothetical protein
MPLLLLEVRSLPKSVTVRFGGDFMNITTRPVYKQFTVVRDTGFEPVTPTVSIHPGIWRRNLPLWATAYRAMLTHAKTESATVKCYIDSRMPRE